MGKVTVAAAVIGGAAICDAAVLVVRNWMQSSNRCVKLADIIKELEGKWATASSKMRQIADAMTVEMHATLASEGGSKLKILISYVDNLPTSTDEENEPEIDEPDVRLGSGILLFGRKKIAVSRWGEHEPQK